MAWDGAAAASRALAGAIAGLAGYDAAFLSLAAVAAMGGAIFALGVPESRSLD